MVAEKCAVQHEIRYSQSQVEEAFMLDTLTNLLERMSGIGCEPSINTYCVLISGLCRDGKSYEADQLVVYMKEKGLTPNEAIYCSLLSAYCKSLRVDPALEMLKLLSDRGFKSPITIYAADIRALCESKLLKQVEVVFDEMLEKQWNSYEVVWTVLIDSLLKYGESKLCLNLLHKMKSKGIPIGKHTCLIVARELHRIDNSNDLNQVIDTLSIMEDKKPG